VVCTKAARRVHHNWTDMGSGESVEQNSSCYSCCRVPHLVGHDLLGLLLDRLLGLLEAGHRLGAVLRDAARDWVLIASVRRHTKDIFESTLNA